MIWDKNIFFKDLSAFNSLLAKHDVPIDKSSLYDLEGKLGHTSDISYTIKDVIFKLKERISGSIPVSINYYEISFDLTFQIKRCSKDLAFKDPFNDGGEYSLQLYIKGTDIENNQDFYNCWHLDRHIEGDNESKVTHPFYHFQNGGNNVEKIGIEGNAMFTGAPRIPHPPMDIFLAFHFIIMNYFNNRSSEFVNNLVSDPDYEEIIDRAQKRMWKPYYNIFNSKEHSDYSINKLIPLYTVH